MASKQLSWITKYKNLLDGAVYTTTQTSAALDTLNTEAASIMMVVGAAAITGTFTPKLQECDTLAGTYTDVDPTLYTEWFVDGVSQGFSGGTAVVPVLSVGVNNSTVISCSYLGGQRRFIKMVVTGASTPSANFAIVGALGFLREVGPKAYTNWPVASATLP